MATCSKCSREATYSNEGGLCTFHWFRWWLKDHTTEELVKISCNPDPTDLDEMEMVAAAYELELRPMLDLLAPNKPPKQ